MPTELFFHFWEQVVVRGSQFRIGRMFDPLESALMRCSHSYRIIVGQCIVLMEQNPPRPPSCVSTLIRGAGTMLKLGGGAGSLQRCWIWVKLG